MVKAHYNGLGYSWRYFFSRMPESRNVCPRGFGNIRCGKQREMTPRWAQEPIAVYGFVDYEREPLKVDVAYEYGLVPDDPELYAEYTQFAEENGE